MNSIDLKNKGFAVKDEILNLLKFTGVDKHEILHDLIIFLNELFDLEPITITKL